MQEEIDKAIDSLNKGNLILCPTDTIWGISCDATNFKAVEKVYKIKKRDKSKSLIVLVSSFEMLEEYIEKEPLYLKNEISKYSKPVTIVYPKAKNLASNVYAQDNSVAIRVVKDGFVKKIIKKLNKPIVSSSANFSGEKTASTFNEINEKLKQEIDFIINEKYGSANTNSSTILKYEKNKFYLIRV